jgi:hypothetical protein
MEHTFAPCTVSAETRAKYAREQKQWPNVSGYKTLPRIQARLQDIKTRLAKFTGSASTTKLKLLNEYRLLYMKSFVLARPGDITDAETRVWAFVRFLWGGDMACAETKEEKKLAANEKTMLLMEIWQWYNAGVAAAKRR